ncbi:uncharacterized protein LOC133520990 [Cydia pomonella]|uniref:uncharacterized protein LOC133520990 n=1 Tax=Cydia pomonella TaxID=82600 RepID=UPI002ADE29A7|nr:uncharacterized protein LOC133520990 [Cydia pomonella]
MYLQGSVVKTVESFKYLGSIISNDGTIDADIIHRKNTGWQKWRDLAGVICDQRMPIGVKDKIYKTAFRPALIYGAECWSLKKQQSDKLHVAEMRMLRWSAWVTLLDKVPNHYIRGTFKVRRIQDKLAETRLWYGHVMRRQEDHMTRKVLNANLDPRKSGRHRLTWIATIKKT